MPERDTLIETFLETAGWKGATRKALADDASFRRYERLYSAGRQAVLMDAPPPQEDVRPFIHIAGHLADHGFSAPRVLAADKAAGFLLLEDLGDDTYARALAGGGDEMALYELAVDVLAALHALPAEKAIPKGLPSYSDAWLLQEACLLIDWYMPAVLGGPPSPEARASYTQVWRGLFPKIRAQPTALVLRDYHVDNLMWLPKRQGVARCGLLDFQDAVSGAAAYDLMSLLEDARRDVDPNVTSAMLKRYFTAQPDVDREAFMGAYAILGAQRHAKVIGIFTRLCIRDGKPAYLEHIPRLWRRLVHSCKHPALAPLAHWLDNNLPREERKIPPCPVAQEK